MAGAAEQQLLEALLERCKAAGLVKPRGRQRTDATAVLAAVRALNRLDLVGETLRHALEALATVAPAWLRAQAPPAWYDRYGARIETTRRPLTAAERDALAATIGADGLRLLRAVGDPAAPAWLREIPAVETLRQALGLQHDHAPEDPRAGPRPRAARDLPPRRRAHRVPVRPGRALPHQAGDLLGRLHGPPDRDLRRRRGRTSSPRWRPCRRARTTWS